MRRSEEAHKKENKVLMVGIVQTPPFPDLPSGDTELRSALYVNVLSHRHDFHYICKWMENAFH